MREHDGRVWRGCDVSGVMWVCEGSVLHEAGVVRVAYLATSERLTALTGQQGLIEDPEAPQQHEVSLHSNAPATHHATGVGDRGEVERRKGKGRDGANLNHFIWVDWWD